MVKSKLVLAFLKALFDRPAHNGGSTQFMERRAPWCIAEGKFTGTVLKAADVQPDGLPGGVVVTHDNADTLLVTDDGTFGTLAKNNLVPGDGGVIRYLRHGDRCN